MKILEREKNILFQVKEFFKDIDVGSGQRMLDQSLEMIKFNIYWVRENADTIDEWLIEYLEKKTS